jgi:transcriptional regulator with XRE-family HTH domain
LREIELMENRQQERVRLSDLARVLGLSTSTVSRALSGNHMVNEETRQRVKATAVEMGFVSRRGGFPRDAAPAPAHA